MSVEFITLSLSLLLNRVHCFAQLEIQFLSSFAPKTSTSDDDAAVCMCMWKLIINNHFRIVIYKLPFTAAQLRFAFMALRNNTLHLSNNSVYV